MKAAFYARYSTERQSETSITDQLRVCSDYAQRYGWEVVREFIDEGISGAAFGNRPGAQALEQFALAGGCNVIVAVDLTRLSRNLGELTQFLERMHFRKVRVLGAQDGYDSLSRSARMQAGLSGIMSEEFRAMIADRTRSALTIRAETGQTTGGRTYGYRDDEAAIVREIFERSAAGDTMKEIASDLNRRGIPSPGANWRRDKRTRNGRWLVSAIHSMLRNERYAGRLVWNRSQWIKEPGTGKRRRVKRPEDEWVIQEVPALIDGDTWAEVQRRFRQNTGRGGVCRYLLSGLLECEICGSKLIVAGGSQRRYVCSTYHNGGEYACSNRQSVPHKIAEHYILEPVLKDMLSPEAIGQAIAEMRSAIREMKPAKPDSQVQELERLVREGVLSSEVAAPALAEARRRAIPNIAAVPLPSERMWRELVQGMREVLQGDDVVAARETLREMLGPIRVSPGEGHMIARLAARQVFLQTGTGGAGIWVGSGGAIQIHIPTSTKGPR
jgi:site-specific DNA recombinase